MSPSDPVEQVLEHYGVKGMKWGVRKNDSGGNRLRRLGKPKTASSEDKARSEALKARVTKKGSTHALSNDELQALVKRMNLEQQYSRLHTTPVNPVVKAGTKTAGFVLKNAGDVATNVAKQHAQQVFKEGTAPFANKLAEELAKKAKAKA